MFDVLTVHTFESMKTLSRTLRATLPTIVLALAGCGGLTGIPIQDCCPWGGGGGSYTYPLALGPTDNMIRGDTAEIFAWTSEGDPKSTWVLSGPAVFVLGPDTVDTKIITPVDRATIRATGAGEVNVKAMRVNSADSATASFFVADSADVTLRIAGSRDFSVGVGAELWIAAQLLDKTGKWYRAALVWSSSDTGTVSLTDAVNPTPLVRMAHARAAGVARVVAAFGAQRDTVRVQVVP